jgi:glycosyltransferase involved in cell wall biosynthesis
MSLNAMMFCHDYNAELEPAGYATEFFVDVAPRLDEIFVDNKAFAATLVSEAGAPKSLGDRFIPLYHPVRGGLPPIRSLPPRDGRRPRIAWAGRFSLQKRVDLLVEVARRVPWCDFSVHGYAYEESAHVRQLRALPNVRLEGTFDQFSKVLASEPDGFLYTSGWDGLPNVLLEAIAAGLPVIASDVGGISELVNEQTGWLIRGNDPGGFVSAMEEWARGAALGEARRRAAHSLLATRHSEATFDDAIRRTRLFGEISRGA